MNKWLLTCLLLLSARGFALADDMNTTLKARLAAFYPTEDRYRHVYGSSMASYQLEATTKYNECYDIWANVDWLNKNGKSNQLRYFTTIKVTNLSFGISIPYKISDKFSAYAGIGAAIGHVYIHNRFTSAHRNEKKFAGGLALKSGLIYEVTCRVFLELFLDYTYQPVQFRRTVDIGGIKTGFGIGSRF